MPRSTMTCPTHFVVEDRTHVHAFDIETCDSCGCQAEAANAVGIRTTAAQMRMLGSKELTERLPELGYCDALGMAVCPACYVDEPIA